MRRPASFEPVNAMKRVFGCVTSASPAVPPGPVKKLTTSRGTPASYKISMKIAAIVGESLEGFTTAVFPVTIDASRHAAHDCRRKIPWRNDHAHAQRNVLHVIFFAANCGVNFCGAARRNSSRP